MIKEIIQKWNRYDDNLEDYFRYTNQSEYGNYLNIVKAIFDNVINIKGCNYGEFNREFDTDLITEIDNGDSRGVLIYLIPEVKRQPSIKDYLFTSVEYGSCYGCDVLKSINNSGEDKLPNEDQIKEYMTLSLHIIQKMKWLDEQNN